MNKLNSIKLPILGFLTMVILLISCNKEEKIATIKETLSRQWQLQRLQKNGDEVIIKDFQKAAIWEFIKSGDFIYTYDTVAIVGEDTSYVEGENSFIWDLSDDQDWVLMTKGKRKVTTTTNGEVVIDEQNIGTEGDYKMEIVTLTIDLFKAKVEMKDSDDVYTYEFNPR